MRNAYKNLSLWILLTFTILSIGIIIRVRAIDTDTIKQVQCKENFNVDMYFKGFRRAIDFTYDNNGTYFIAYKDRIQIVNEKGYSDILFRNSKLKITSIEYNNGDLYYASENKVYKYNIKNKKHEELIKQIPNYGDYKDTKIKIDGKSLYVTVGAATNSAVVGKDNLWIDNYERNCDISPKPITIKGQTIKNYNTGAFVPYKTKNIDGQILNSALIGNASIITCDLQGKNIKTYAWGIRNIKGLDFDSNHKMFATIGGMENRGARPVEGDVDYIYNLNKNIWYGWPDYSGGDPVNSPRFKDSTGKSQEPVLLNPPSTNPPAPFYQHKSVSTLGEMTIDTEGILGKKDMIYFYEKQENILYALSKDKVLSEKVKFPSHSNICSIKFCSGKLLLLDSSKGILYKIDC